MNPNDRLQLLRALDEQSITRGRRANRWAWVSVLLAGLVMAALVGTAGRKLREVNARIERAQIEIAQKQKDLTKLDEELRKKQNEAGALNKVLNTLPDQQRSALLDKAIDQSPQVAQALPRIYLHILVEEDRPFAEQMAAKLRDAGYLTLGIELVTRVAVLRQSDVRFYKSNDRPEAERIANVIRAAGEPRVLVNHLTQYEQDPRARPNHFEVWFSRRALPVTDSQVR